MPKQSSAGGRLSRGNNIPARSARKRLSVLEKSQALSKALTSQRGREVLLDTALSVFDECHRESERDKNAARFVDNSECMSCSCTDEGKMPRVSGAVSLF